MHGSFGTYPPLDTLKPVARDVWIVDGPIIHFGMPWPKMPFPTRMTVIRLADGGLWLHSPTKPTAALMGQIDATGSVRHLIGPNRIHYWWIPDWRKAYPRAETWLAPRIREQADGRIDFETQELAGPSDYPWDDEIATLPVAGDFMTEFVFFHRASRTLILTDLIENFEPRKLGFFMRLLTRLGGVLDPDGQMPRDMRLTFRKHREGVARAVRQMIDWKPERIVLAHGRWYERDGTAELERAFRWVL